jgi:predicted AlkP superfamily phosphohydrolase/phosphomutase
VKRRLIIIGLDGATFDIIRPLAKEGRLPFLNESMEKGVHGVLKSTYPPITAPAWTTFMTGKNPGKHGLFDFQKTDDKGTRSLTYSTDCKSATIWDYLTAEGLRSLLVNIPMTYPPKPLNGLCIAGFPVPSDSNYVYPPERLTSVKEVGYWTDWTEILTKERLKSRIKAMKEVERVRIDLFSKLLEADPWDVAMVVISGTDHIAHFEWQKGNRKAVEDFYVYIDGLLSNVGAKGLFADATVLIMSDHGFTQSDYVFYMNMWLMKEGYLTYRDGLDNTYDKFAEERRRSAYGEHGRLAKVLGSIGLTRDQVLLLAKHTGLIKLERFMPHGFARLFPARDLVPEWGRTKVYMTSNLAKGLNVNLRGREPYGTVREEEYTPLRLEVVEKLRSLRLGDGSDVFEFIDLKERVYHGPFLDQAPDIVIWPTNKCNIKLGRGRKDCLEKTIEAHHALDGVFILDGEDMSPGERRDMDMTEIAPTLIHYLGLPCPEDMDGNPAKDLFKPGSEPAARAVVFREPLGIDHTEAHSEVSEEGVRTRLKSLGYL